MAKKLFKNYGTLDQVLNNAQGMDGIRFQPGAIVEMDEERLKLFAPEDVKNIRPYVPEAKPALVQPGPAPKTEDEIASAELVALLRDANAESNESDPTPAPEGEPKPQ